MIPADFHFIRPYWLLAFLPLAFLLFMMLKRRLRSRKWETFCDKELLPHILIGEKPVSRRKSAFLIALAGSLIITALAGPAWQKLPQPVFSTQSALIIALDLSQSMNAGDISPSRLERARFKVADILEKRAEGETALIVYAGDAFTVTPLTDDAATIESQLKALTTDIMPAYGNRTELALSKAGELLRQAGVGKGDVLIITDEINLDRTETIAAEMRNDGYRLSILGIGTREGAPISMPDGSFFKDQTGEIVIPKLNEEPMRRLSQIGGGRFLMMTMDDRDINQLDQFFSSNFEEGDINQTDFETDVWQEQGPWLLLLLAPLAALVFRRGVLIVLFLMCFPLPRDGMAVDWESLWLTPDQRAEKILNDGDAQLAADLFEDPAWKGAAHYRAGNFDESIRSLQDTEDIESQYNLGNALARKGMYEEAIAMYSKVLEQIPEHEDARYNKELLEEEMQQQEQQQQQQSFSNQDQQQQEQQQESQDQQQQQDQAQQQQNQQQQDQNQAQQQQQTEQQSDQSQEQQPEEQQEEAGQPEPLQARQDQLDEEQQATEQWLRRIPDDPGGLLRRKFLLQYQQRQHERIPGEKTW